MTRRVDDKKNNNKNEIEIEGRKSTTTESVQAPRSFVCKWPYHSQLEKHEKDFVHKKKSSGLIFLQKYIFADTFLLCAAQEITSHCINIKNISTL